MVLELTGLSTAAGSANDVILTSAGDAFENETVKSADKLILGGLESGKEYQEFTIPVGTDIFAFHSVTIWNSKYQVNFTTAPLR